MRSVRWLLGMVAATALAAAPPAPAEPGAPEPLPTPPPPVVVPQQPGIGDALAQNGTQPSGLFGLPDLSAYGSNMLLGQSPGPVPPGDPAATIVPDLNAFNPEYLLGQNLTPAAPDQGESAPGLGPDQNDPGTGRIAFLRRLYEMYQAGALKGALLGQHSPEQFAEQPVAPTAPAD